MSSALGSPYFTTLTGPGEHVALKNAAGGEILPPAVALAWADEVAPGSGSDSPAAEPPPQQEPTPNPTSAADFFPELHFPFWGPIWFPDPDNTPAPLRPEQLHSLPEFEFYESPFFEDYKIFDKYIFPPKPIYPNYRDPNFISSPPHDIEGREYLALIGMPLDHVLEA
jgi:hypothetical protein